jgi:hypothetical protein
MLTSPIAMSGKVGTRFRPCEPPKGTVNFFQMSRMTSPAANEPIRK